MADWALQTTLENQVRHLVNQFGLQKVQTAIFTVEQEKRREETEAYKAQIQKLKDGK